MNIGKSKKRSCSSMVVLATGVLVITIFIASIMVVCHGDEGKIFDRFTSIVAALLVVFPAIGLLLLAYFEFERSRRYQNEAFVNEYISRIFTNEEFADTFYYLIYTYDRDVFSRVEKVLKGLLNEEGNIVGSLQEEMYKRLECLQHGREEGCRFYHPELFQGSVEERRLDTLLGYFNIIANYYFTEKGRILPPDYIDESIGFYLHVMAGSRVIKKYFEHIKKTWKEKENIDRFGTSRPFPSLEKLLKEVEDIRLDPRNGVDPP